MSARKKRSSASDVLRQELELQQPLVIPSRQVQPPEPASPKDSDRPQPTPTPIPNSLNLTNMTPPTNDAAANEAKLQKEIEELKSKLKEQTTSSQQLQAKTDSLTKELKDAKDTVVKLAEQSKPAPTSTALAKAEPAAAQVSRASLTARPTLSSAETAIRRANTDIGWLD